MKFQVNQSKKHENLVRRPKNMNLRYRFLGILDFEKSNIFQEKSRIYFLNLQTKFSERCR